MTRREFPALGFDPAPGDPAALTGAASRATAAATTFATAADHLRPAHWTGDAGDACRAMTGPLPTDLTRAAEAHRTSARALANYASGLRHRQRRADTLEAEATALRGREAAAIAEVNRLAVGRAPTGSAELADLSARYTAARSSAESTGMDLARILADAKLLSEDHRTAADATARIIRAAADTAPYEKPGLLSRALARTKRWITDHGDVLTSISTVLKGVSTVLGTLSLVPGLQFLAPFAIAAGAVALTIDAAIKLATGRGSWANLALDTALTAMPWGRVYRTLKQVPELDLALASYNRAIPDSVKGKLFRLGRNLPEGITHAQAAEAHTLIRAQAPHYGDDVIVQGSRAKYRIHPGSDVDLGLRVDPDEFRRIVDRRFAGEDLTGEAGEFKQACLEKGIVHYRRAGMKQLQKELEATIGQKVDISVISRGGRFDPEPWLRLR